MTNTLTQGSISDAALPPIDFSPAQGCLSSLHESFSGLRILCLTAMRNEDHLGPAVTMDDKLDAAAAPLVARFAALVFAERDAMIEPLLQQLRWTAYEHDIDHIVLPLWPEARLSQRLCAVAADIGMPANFILMQDETTWPDQQLDVTANPTYATGYLRN